MASSSDLEVAPPQLFDIGNSLPDVALELRTRACLKHFPYLAAIVAESLAIVVLVFRLAALTPNPYARPNSAPGQAPTGDPLLFPLAAIDYHTSADTFNRIKYFHRSFFAQDPFVKNGTFAIRAVVSSNANVRADILPVVHLQCGDEIRDLACRTEKSYPVFLNSFPNCGWLFRADDDTFINTSLLYRYLLLLNSVYNPREMIVFRAHANREGGGQYYIHGGSGWLVSRAYVETIVRRGLSIVRLLNFSRYRQQDTAESIIVRHMFPAPELWDEMGFAGYECQNCEEDVVGERWWAELPLCPSDVCIRVRDLFAIHTKSQALAILDFIRAIPSAPDEVMLARDVEAQRHIVCKQAPNTRVWNVTRRAWTFLRDNDLPEALIDFSTIEDEDIRFE
jgi:hypothetical protein